MLNHRVATNVAGRPARASGKRPRRLLVALALLAIPALSACGPRAELPPVFGAVFGVPGARGTPFVKGRIPERAATRGDRLVGSAANMPGQCIYRTPANRRFRAACPENFQP